MKLIKSPNLILSQTAIDWDFTIDTNAKEIESEMIQLMLENNGIGLAANQVGLLKRVFAIKLKDKSPIAMFNPKVLSTSTTTQLSNEGCLSFPDLWLDVTRPQIIESEYFDNLGNKCTITLTGIDARCFLHELDHLNGIVFTDKVSQIKLILARKKQQKRKHNG